MSKKRPDRLDEEAVPFERTNSPDEIIAACIGPRRIVAIGASAGGLEALEGFFENVTPDSGDAYVVIQHLSEEFESHMASLLGRKTSLPVATAEHDNDVQPNHIYLIPKGKLLEIESLRLKLRDIDPKILPSMPINIFFQSLARARGECAVAVVLSGGGSDGTNGAMAIHHAGGRVIVQDPRSAQFDSMPQNAINTGIFDLILRPGQMAEAIAEFGRSKSIGQAGALLDEKKPIFDRIMTLLNEAYAVDFSVYKPATIIRRIERCIQIDQVSSIEDYAERLASNVEELDKLYEHCLIGVTQFFRDPLQYACLETKIVPELIKQGMAHGEIRVWVAGCASGEEAYSIAMLLDEATCQRDIAIRIRIFATDIHGASLHRAMSGMFSEEAVVDLSSERLSRYFFPENGGYRIVPTLKEMVILTRHNLVQDPPFTNMDLVTCRNLLIYLDNEAQEKVIARLHFALRDQGYLFLGSSERPGRYEEEFEPVSAQVQLFRKRRNVRLIAAATPIESRLPVSLGERRRPPLVDMPTGLPASLARAYDFLLNKIIHRGFLTDGDGGIHHTFGDAGRYTQLSGSVQTNLLALVDQRLKPAIHTTLLRARRSEASERSGFVQIQMDGIEERLRIEAQAMPPDHHGRRVFLVLFLPENVLPDNVEALLAPDEPKGKVDEITWLRQELIIARQSLDNLMQEVGIRNEELQAANEELTASNEELQSTNEELQSVNEELYTVNNEYQKKILELQNTTDDLNNLIRSTEIGVIFTDNELNIRRFTPKATEFLNLLETDIGRSLKDINPRLQVSDLSAMASSIVTEGKIHEEEVRTEGDHWYLMRVLPYRGKGKNIEGVVLAFIDIGERKAAEQSSRLAKERFDLAVSGSGLGIWDWNIKTDDLFGSDRFKELIGVDDASFKGKIDDFKNRVHPDDVERVFEAVDAHLSSSQPFDIQFWMVRDDGADMYLQARGSAIRSDEGEAIRFVGVIDDLSLRQRREQALNDVQTFADLADSWVWITDQKHQFSYLSVATKTCHRPPAFELGKTPWKIAGIDPSKEPQWSQFVTDLDAHRRFQEFEFSRIDNGGDERWYVISGEPIFDENGQFEGYRGVGRDVTATYQQLKYHSREVDNFAYIASHDLKAPLRAISLHVDMLLEGDRDHVNADVAKRLSHLGQLSAQMEKLVADLLYFSRIGRYQTAVEQVDLNAIIAEFEASFADRLRAQNITISMPGALPVIQGRLTDLTAMFNCLIENAITYNEAKRKKVEIGVVSSIDHDGSIETDVLYVQDNGIGIADEFHDTIFRIFKRLNHEKAYGEGSGAGLAFVKKIVENHGGKVWLQSKPGSGTTFFVKLG